MENTDIVYLHREGQGRLVNAGIATPVATPCQIEYQVEGLVIGIVEYGMVAVVRQQQLSVNVCLDLVSCPLQCIDVIFCLCSTDVAGLGNLGVVGVVVSFGVQTG